MSRPEAILAYQNVDLEKQQLETNVRTTEARQRYNKLSKLLKNQQATIKKLTDDLDVIAASLKKLNQQHEEILSRIELESSELEILVGDEEASAE